MRQLVPLVLSGRVVPLTRKTSIAPGESASFAGRVYLADDGTITAVTKSGAPAPAGFTGAPVVDVGSSLILPGFIDLHSHLAYATLPLWVEDGRTEPFLHHNIWPTRPTYADSVTFPAYTFITACPEELLAYAEVRALVGGTTSIQGSPPSNRPLDAWLVRNIEDETLKGQLDADRILASTLTVKNETLGVRAGQMTAGAAFIYHCAEGKRGTIVAREFEAARLNGCLQPRFVAIHTNALELAGYGAWTDPGAVVWSPFSNLWLYGETTDVPTIRARDITLCLGSDWGPSGMRDVLGELKVAAVVSRAKKWNLTDFQLVKLITANPGEVLSPVWGKVVGRLEPGALGDVVVISASAGADPFETVVEATEKDVKLVIVAGRPLYGTKTLMTKAGATGTSDLKIAGETRALALTHNDGSAWSFAKVLDRMEEVRAAPKKEIEKARTQAYRAYAGALPSDPPPLRLALDMPTGIVPVGGLPKDLGTIVVPEIQPIEHDADFFTQVQGRGFHGGLLDEVADFY